MHTGGAMEPQSNQCGVQLPTQTVLRLQCGETEKSVRLFEKWMAANPWLNEAQVDTAMPWFAYVCFNPRSKGLVLARFGACGWRVSTTGEIRKEINGVTVAVAAA